MKPLPIRSLLFCVAIAVAFNLMLYGEPAPSPSPVDASSEAKLPAVSNTYKLSPKDIVHIKVFQEDDLETTARIAKDRTIPFPMLGNVKIGGETLPEATATLEQMLRVYLVKPQVSLTIVEYSKRRITILGQVVKPGTYDMPDDSTVNLLEAIGMAGGYSRIADEKDITVKRIVQGKEVIFKKLNGKRMLQDNSTPTFEVLPGDTILVGESPF
jgi:polysaccharide export outer membrane protein